MCQRISKRSCRGHLHSRIRFTSFVIHLFNTLTCLLTDINYDFMLGKPKNYCRGHVMTQWSFLCACKDGILTTNVRDIFLNDPWWIDLSNGALRPEIYFKGSSGGEMIEKVCTGLYQFCSYCSLQHSACEFMRKKHACVVWPLRAHSHQKLHITFLTACLHALKACLMHVLCCIFLYGDIWGRLSWLKGMRYSAFETHL